MSEQAKRDPGRDEYERRKAELKEAIRNAAAWNREVVALEKIVTGYEDYFAARPADRGGQTVFEIVREVEEPIEAHPAIEADESNFRAAIFEIIADQKRGTRFPKIKTEAEKRHLKTSGATLDAAIRYAINGLKGQGKIRTPRRGVYKVAPSKPLPGTSGAIPLALAATNGG
ncbi:MAG: hypothetical protein WB438_02995 [Candidatus Cybelea sp.]